MRTAKIFVHRAVWESVCPEKPTTENVGKYLLWPAEYRVTNVWENSQECLVVTVENDAIPEGAQFLKPVYETKYVEFVEGLHREVRFDHMESA